MGLPEVVIEFGDVAALEEELRTNLNGGGVLAPAAGSLETDTDCAVVLVHPAADARMSLTGRVVYVDGSGARIAIIDFSPAVREELIAFVACRDKPPAPNPDPDPNPSSDSDSTSDPDPDPDSSADSDADSDADPDAPRARRKNLHERLRGLSVAEQNRVARDGDANERVVLERLYGKTVWEALLKNPRLSIAEVTRISRMGALPRPLLELIVANPAWCAAPQIRRSLLGNRRLPRELGMKLLRALPKHELRLVPKQSSYPAPIRDAARKLLQNS